MQWMLWGALWAGCTGGGAPSEPAMPELGMEDLQARLAEHRGAVVQVTGRYRALSAGDEWLRVIVVDGPDKKQGLDCWSKNGPPFQGLASQAEVVVRGRVEERRGKLGLVDCERVVE